MRFKAEKTCSYIEKNYFHPTVLDFPLIRRYVILYCQIEIVSEKQKPNYRLVQDLKQLAQALTLLIEYFIAYRVLS
jgi:hypothetical protein